MSDAGGGASGSGGAGRGGGASQGNNAGATNNAADRATADAPSAASAPSTGALGASMSAALSSVAAAVKGLVSSALDSIAPAGTFASSLLGQIATQLGVPEAIVESRVMDVAYAALRTANPSLALADGLVATGQATVASALTSGLAELATRHGMPGFAAKALADVAARQLAATNPNLGQSVASAMRQGFAPALDQVAREMGQDFAREVAARVESLAPGATRGLAKAGTSVWRDAVQASVRQTLGQAPQRLQQAVPALIGNPGLGQLTQALSAGRGAPANATEALALRDPNAYVEQALERFTARLAEQAQQALA